MNRFDFEIRVPIKPDNQHKLPNRTGQPLPLLRFGNSAEKVPRVTLKKHISPEQLPVFNERLDFETYVFKLPQHYRVSHGTGDSLVS